MALNSLICADVPLRNCTLALNGLSCADVLLRTYSLYCCLPSDCWCM